MKRIGDLVINDGRGIYDNEGIAETLIDDLNNLLKALISQQYIFCIDIVVQMSQKIDKLRKGINADMNDLKYQLEDMKRLNNELLDRINDGGGHGGSAEDSEETEAV